MPDIEVVEPAPQPSVEENNSARRDAIMAKSQAALKAAIAKVADDPVASPRAARMASAVREIVQPAPVEPEPVEPAADPEPVAEEQPAAEVEAPPAEQPVAVQKASSTLERKARQAIAGRRDRQAREAAEARNAQLEAELNEIKGTMGLLREKPLEALAKAGHDPAKLVPDWLKRVAEPEKTPEQKAADERDQKLAELEAWKKQQELNQRSSTVNQQVAAYQQQCAEAIVDKAAFEYVHRDGGTEALYNYIVDNYNLAVVEHRAGRITAAQVERIAKMPPAAYAKQMETDLRRKFGPAAATGGTPGSPRAAAQPARVPAGVDPSYVEAARNVRGSRSLRQKQAGKARPAEDEEPTTISARASAVRTVPHQKRMNDKDVIAKAVAELDRANRAAAGRR